MKIITIGLDGPNRVGKGTQIQLLATHLKNLGGVVISIKGDGSRPGIGEEGDPHSNWWEKTNRIIHQSASTELWDMAACRLSRELLIWKNRWLPKKMNQYGSNKGYLLIDRTILSRYAFALEKGRSELNNLYSSDLRLARRGIGYLELCPDFIIRLCAPRDCLLNRLDESDPKYTFRRSLIERPVDWYEKASKTLPINIQKRIITIESTATPELVFENILTKLREHFPDSF